jgi:16S rRNA A1518/A1519 N6-dimethyltransferase RsmA/KsgA/DIM1 with predicted DNA glycosylase/AP lyase activity
MIDVIDTICKDSIFNFSEIEKKDIDKSLSTLSSDTIKKICDIDPHCFSPKPKVESSL